MKYRDLETSFYYHYKLATDKSGWQASLNAISSAENSGELDQVVNAVTSSAQQIIPALEAIDQAGLGEDDLKNLLSMATKIGGITTAEINVERIEKFARAYKKASRKKQQQLLKQAGLTDMISGVAGFLGGSDSTEGGGGIMGALGPMMGNAGLMSKLLPYAGSIMKGVLGFKNLMDAINGYIELIPGINSLGMKWWETFFPGKLEAALESNSNDPEKVGIIGTICSYASKFIEKALVPIMSGITNSKAAFDLVVKALSSISPGIGGIVSSISSFLPILSGLLEYGVGTMLSSGHKSILGKVYDLINSRIGGASPAVLPSR